MNTYRKSPTSSSGAPRRVAQITRVARIATASLALAALGASIASSSASAASNTKTTKAAATKPAVNPNAPEVLSAGDIPDNIAYVAYKPAAGGYSITTPEGWSRKDITNGAVFTDKYNIIQVEALTAQKQPTPATVTATVKAKLGKSKGFVFTKSSTVTRKAGSAALVTYLVNSAPNEVTGKTIPVAVERYEFFKNGTSVVLTLSGAKGADNVDPWKIVTDSFKWA